MFAEGNLTDVKELTGDSEVLPEHYRLRGHLHLLYINAKIAEGTEYHISTGNKR